MQQHRSFLIIEAVMSLRATCHRSVQKKYYLLQILALLSVSLHGHSHIMHALMF